MAENPTPQPSASWDRQDTVRALFTMLILAAFFAATVFLFIKVDKAENEHWFRYVHLFRGLEGIVLIAVGWLFGKEVHRHQAEAAERRVQSAEQARDRAHADMVDALQQARAHSERGASLVHALDVRRSDSQQVAAMPPVQAVTMLQRDMEQLWELADRLFPNARASTP